MAKEKENSNIILKDIHCPYCGSEKALLLSRTTSKKISIQLPAFGLKFILSLICPECGNSYSMAPPEAIKEEVKEPKFYRVREGKAIMGFCTGVSKYTGIPLLWVRIMGAFYGITLVGIALYFLISICVPFEEDVNGEQ